MLKLKVFAMWDKTELSKPNGQSLMERLNGVAELCFNSRTPEQIVSGQPVRVSLTAVYEDLNAQRLVIGKKNEKAHV